MDGIHCKELMSRNFRQLLNQRWNEDKFVCVGLDPDLDKIPAHLKHGSPAETIFEFNKAIIDSTYEYVCAFKPQSAYYEAVSPEGIDALKKTVAYINQVAPNVPVILDAKRADIGSTNEAYTQAIFDNWGMDAVTLQPYLGGEAIQPFLDRADKGLIILCRTSNPGAGEFQDLEVNGEPLYMHVADSVSKQWNTSNNCCLVVGATYPEEARKIRERVGDMPFLIPGIGAQGGDVTAIVQSAQDSRGQGMIINSSRAIIFASAGPDFAEAARSETIKLHDAINAARTPSQLSS